jgi:2',3'-cyclic-nucleotide 2'-phosphodiesterase (5'-nucleotidase family)
MITSKKYDTFLYRFVLFLTFTTLASCGPKRIYNSRIEGKKLPVTGEIASKPELENFIAPYREHINKDLDEILAYSPETLDKSKPIKKWQTTIGNLLADVTHEKADRLFKQRHSKNVDICLLNHGGIRAIIPQGNVTTRTAFQVMPFENSLIIIALKGEQIREMADYIIREKKPHPLSGMKIVIDANNVIKNITVNNKPVENDRIYYVATSDYLSNGGDNMEFFKKATGSFDMDYKLRNLFIDYFKEADTIPVIKTERIITE